MGGPGDAYFRGKLVLVIGKRVENPPPPLWILSRLTSAARRTLYHGLSLAAGKQSLWLVRLWLVRLCKAFTAANWDGPLPRQCKLIA